MSATPTIPPPPPDMTNVPGGTPNGPVPVPGSALPAFDNTLGALFIGSNLSMLLYGVICLQMFIYVTGKRSRNDRSWTRMLVFFIFVSLVDTTHQAMTTAAMYKFLITDFLNPFALASGGAGSAEVFTYAQSISGTCAVLLCQLFFSWRVWAFSGACLNFPARATISLVTVLLALFSFGSSIDLAITGFNHRILTVNTPDFLLAYKLSSSSRIVFDIFITFAMTLTLYCSKSGIKRSDHVVKLLILFTVNTNLLTTLLSIFELVTFLAFPRATVYGGLGFLSPKTYFNTLLSALNARDYMRNELNSDSPISTLEHSVRFNKSKYNFGSSFFTKESKPSTNGADDSFTFVAASRSDPESNAYQMRISNNRELVGDASFNASSSRIDVA